jgi:hypothetical protein
MNTRIRSILSATDAVLAITTGVSHGQVNSIVESFTTTVCKDTVNTTADWVLCRLLFAGRLEHSNPWGAPA